VPVCSPGGLAAVYVDSSGAAGSDIVEYGFRNLTTRRCELTGYPAVQMLTTSGGKLSTTDEHAAAGAFGITIKPVPIAHNAVAYFGVVYASATGFANLSCPSSAALRLTPPGATTGLVLKGRGGRIQPYGGTTVHLQCGIVHVGPVTAKRFQ